MTQEAAHAHMTQEASWLDRAGGWPPSRPAGPGRAWSPRRRWLAASAMALTSSAPEEGTREWARGRTTRAVGPARPWLAMASARSREGDWL